MCEAIIAVKPDLVITEKGVSGEISQRQRALVKACGLAVSFVVPELLT
jgi:ABC-type Fe3+-hydroxamate transport system substrate-binding protein